MLTALLIILSIVCLISAGVLFIRYEGKVGNAHFANEVHNYGSSKRQAMYYFMILYLKCAEELSVDPSECIVLEDSSNGCLSGKRAGCFVIAVPTEYTDHQDFSMADVIVEDLFEAWKVVGEG